MIRLTNDRLERRLGLYVTLNIKTASL